MSVATQAGSWLVVACILAASYYFYSNHKYLTYVYTADSFEPFYLNIPPKALSSIMENTCSWPILPSVNISRNIIHSRARSIKCDRVMDSFAFLDDYGFLELSKPILDGELFFDSGITCYYEPLLNNTAGKVIIGEAVKVEFDLPTAIRHDQFIVKCYRVESPKKIVYNKAFVNVPVAMGPSSKQKFAKSDPERPSIALLVFDSVSLNHFKRSMPKTAKFLVDNDFFTFNMYNEMSNDTFANLHKILSGGDDQERSAETEYLWDVMRDRQCITYLSEEIDNFPSFFGNTILNVDHDLRPFYSYSRQTAKGFCTPDGQIASNENLENWRNTLIHSKEWCHFSMHYMRTFSSGTSENLSVLDAELRQSLDVLKGNGLFENTVFVLVAARGNLPIEFTDQVPAVPVEYLHEDVSISCVDPHIYHWVGDELFTARVEERSPLLSIKLPEKFLKKYVMQKVSMEYNVNRLTSTKDVGLTLMDLANLTFLELPIISDYEDTLGGASFLRAIHEAFRSCDDANIPPHMCLCMDEKTLLSETYTNDTMEYQQLFDYTKTEILLNDCIEKVVEPRNTHTLKVLSLNAMVQQGVKGEKDWSEVRKSHNDLGMNYVDIIVSARAIQRSTDPPKMKFLARMRFRNTSRSGFEPIGNPVIAYSPHKCHTHRVDQYCEMCYYNHLVT